MPAEMILVLGMGGALVVIILILGVLSVPEKTRRIEHDYWYLKDRKERHD